MSIDFSIVTAAVPPLLEGLKVTAQVCVLGIPLGIVAGTVATSARSCAPRSRASRTASCRRRARSG